MATLRGSIPSWQGFQDAKGKISTQAYQWFQSIAGLVDNTITNVGTDVALKAQTLRPEPIFMESPQAKYYRVWLNRPRGCTIASITTRSEAGTCTVTGKINTTALGGTANSASTTEQTQTYTSANVMVAGDDFLLTISSLSGCTGLSIMLAYSETLD